MNNVGRYVIVSELGRGAMGIVYKASDPTIDREVALKVLSLSASGEQGTNSPQELFMREVRAAGRLSHPSIVTIYDAFDDQETRASCIVMELVPGKTLEKILETGHNLNIEQILSLVRQIAEGLDYAHRNQVIHRDLKPANILVTADGLAKITDFGIAKVLAREGAARTVGVMGTPSYMSPEQVRGTDVDAGTDIFSLGIILFTMLAGKKPFVGNTAAVMFKIVYEEPVAPSTINPQLTPAYDYVVKKCLAKDRKNRYITARDLVADLDDLQNGRPPRSETAAAALSPTAVASSTDKTVAMTIPGMIKTSPQPPAPRPGPRIPQSVPSQVRPAQPGGTIAQAPTIAMPTSQLPNSASQRPAQHSGPPQRPPEPPTTPIDSRDAVAPPATVAMPISELMKAASQQPAVRSAPPQAPKAGPVRPRERNVPPPGAPMPSGLPLTGRTVPLPIPDLSAVSPPAPPQSPRAPMNDEPILMERTLSMRVPDLAGLSSQPPSFPHESPPRPAPLNSPPIERTLPPPKRDDSAVEPQAPPPSRTVPSPPLPQSSVAERLLPTPTPDLPSWPPAAGLQSTRPVPIPQLAATHPEEPIITGASSPPTKSKLLPAVVGFLAVALVAGAMLVYWGVRRARTSASLPSQVAVQTETAAPPPIPTPTTPPTPSPAPTVEETAPPVTASPPVTKKSGVHKSKPVVGPPPSAPEPAPAPAQPQPSVVTPPSAPTPAAPSPEAIARAEAARLANVPRIVQVSCNYGLKEATFTFSSGGRTLFEETFKGKKKKEGFLGIKGSYQGIFTRTLTVPAGAAEVSLHVVAKDGATDLNKAIKMPSPGGFVPTLTVSVDNEHLSLDWKGSSTAF